MHLQAAQLLGDLRLAGEEAGSVLGRLLADLATGRYIVDSDAQLQTIFNELSADGTPIEWQGYDGEVVELPDGTQIGLRNASRSGGRAIDIVQGSSEITIHIGP